MPVRLADIIEGLRGLKLPTGLLWDAEGIELYGAITRLLNYYPATDELALLRAHRQDLASVCPAGGCVVDFGGSTNSKGGTTVAAIGATYYMPVDFAPAFGAGVAVHEGYAFQVIPVIGDILEPISLPDEARGKPLLGFTANTLCNFEPHEVQRILRSMRWSLGAEARLLVVLDTCKDKARLEEVYNDDQGCFEAFLLHPLHRLKNEFNADLDVAAFHANSKWNKDRSRVEMSVVSATAQSIAIGGQEFHIPAHWRLDVVYGYRYSLPEFIARAANTGWQWEQSWSGETSALVLFRAAPARG